jgi:single-strand DNA-binding protein
MTIQVTVKGNLGSDPELKFVKTARGDTGITTFSLAYTPRERKNDQWVDGETMWFRVIQWGDKGEQLIDHLSKGDTVIVTGQMKQSTFKGKDGADKTALEINATDIGLIPRIAKKKAEVPTW